MTTDLADANAALDRLAMGANYAHDVRLIRTALDQLEAQPNPPADDVREALPSSDGALTPDQVMQHAYANAVTRAPGRMTWGEALRHFEMWMREHDARLIAEVRPRGTVTDAEAAPRLPDDCECEDREALVGPEGLVCGTCGKVIDDATRPTP